MAHWHPEMLVKLVSHLEPDPDILGLILFGSCSLSPSSVDDWSDIDLLLVVSDQSLERFYPTLAWLEDFGKVYTYSQSADDTMFTTRVCFEDFKRLDFVITTQRKLIAIDHWDRVPDLNNAKILFSRSKVVAEVPKLPFNQPKFPPLPPDQFQHMVRDFRFKSMLAVTKVVRDDLLIALHLTQDLVRDCCLLAMMIRDRATGTRVHKQGGIGNDTVKELENTRHPFTPIGILESIQACNLSFENLAGEWSRTYVDNRQPLLDWIDKAKAEVNARG